MMLRPLRTTCQPALRIVLYGFLLSFTPPAIQAQTTTGTSMLDNWRSNFNRQLDDEMEGLTSAHRVETISATGAAPDERNNTSAQQDTFPGFAYRRAGHSSVVIKGIFQSQGLPTSLIGVAAVESGFNPAALSPKGAAGLWQFMPGTARQYGLVVNANQDDRFDVLKSTAAAAQYLHALHDQFGDWPLALAAYNAGPNRVVHGIDRINARNFWALSRDFALPDETRDYVPRVLAVMRDGLTGQDIEPEHRTSWNRSVETARLHSMYPNREGAVVFAVTSPEALISQGGK